MRNKKLRDIERWNAISLFLMVLPLGALGFLCEFHIIDLQTALPLLVLSFLVPTLWSWFVAVRYAGTTKEEREWMSFPYKMHPYMQCGTYTVCTLLVLAVTATW